MLDLPVNTQYSQQFYNEPLETHFLLLPSTIIQFTLTFKCQNGQFCPKNACKFFSLNMTQARHYVNANVI